MEVMTQGFERVQEIPIGEIDARRSVHACAARRCCRSCRRRATATATAAAADRMPIPEGQARAHAAHADRGVRRAVPRRATATTSRPRRTRRSASWPPAAATRRRSTSPAAKRRSTFAENCTQCMECIAVCPDTALPNCSQDLETMLRTAVTNYVTDAGERQKMFRSLPEIEKRTRELMRDAVAKNDEDAAPGPHSRGHQRRRRLLAGGEERVLRRHRQGAAGVSEDERDLRDAGEEDPRRGRRVLDLRVGPLQRLRGVRHGVRRAPGAADGAGNRRGQRRARDRHARSSTCCPTRRRSTSASTTTRGRRIPRPPRCATC